MSHQIEIAYLGLEVPDPSALTPLFADVVGLVPGDSSTADAPTWRNDDKAHRILVDAGPRNDATVLGIEAADVAAFDALIGRVCAAGLEVLPGTDAEAASRRVERLVSTTAPWGVRVELVLGLAESARQLVTPLVPGGFLTAGQGFGHAVFATTAFEDSRAFVTDVLGMRQSDWLEMELVPGVDLEVRFFHCNERHHSVAIARAPFELPQALHHLMVEVNDLDDVGRSFDRAFAAEVPIANGLGRHDNDGMFSFYVESPAGFQVEVGYGGRRVHDDWDDDRVYDRISSWGHQPVKR